MSATQRTKGNAGEREVARILRDWLGLDIHRNWQAQSAEGGADLAGIPGWAVEIKRAKVARIEDWWQQTIRQAHAGERKPALIYRLDGFGRGMDPEDKWQVIVRACQVLRYSVAFYDRVQMPLRTWMQIVRDELSEEALNGHLSDSETNPLPSQVATTANAATGLRARSGQRFTMTERERG
jgi:hypothetical protein